MKTKSIAIHALWSLPLLVVSSVVVSTNGFVLPTNAVPSTLDLPTSTDTHRRIGDTELLASADADEGSSKSSIPIARGGGDGAVAVLSPEEERSKANEIMIYCAKITALSALVDFAVDGSTLFSELKAGNFVIPLTTLWKVSFAFNTWRISKLHKETSKTQTMEELCRVLEKFLIAMTGIWRRLAFFVSLITVQEVVLAWKDAVPNLRLALSVLFGVVGIVSMWLSAKETQSLAVDDDSSSATRGSNRSGDEDSIQRVVRIGRVTVRAMMLGVSAFVLSSVMTPVVALSKPKAEWIGDLVELLTVSVPFAVLLSKLRKAYITFLEDLMGNHKKATGIKPETQIQLAVAQQNFWGKIKEFQQCEIFFKAVAVVVQLKLARELAAGVFGVFGK